MSEFEIIIGNISTRNGNSILEKMQALAKVEDLIFLDFCRENVFDPNSSEASKAFVDLKFRVVGMLSMPVKRSST